MGKLTPEIFNESCCDGGSSGDCHTSAKMCGCDPAAGWTCARHRGTFPPFALPSNLDKPCPIENHLNTVVNKTWNYAGKLHDFQDEVMNASLGLAGESGEVADTVKKMFFHKEQEGRRTELLEELGDVAYYFTKMLDLFGFTLEEVLEANTAKLFKRHAHAN